MKKKILWLLCACLVSNLSEASIQFRVLDNEQRTAEVIGFYNPIYYPNGYYTGDIVIPETVTKNGVSYTITRIGNRAFYKCTKLTSVFLPNTIERIESEAFYGDEGLLSINLPDSLTYIGSNAFWNCKRLNSSIVLPEKISIINKNTFEKCESITSVVLPTTLDSICSDAFASCTSLTSIDLPNCLTYLGSGVFNGCRQLQSIRIPNKVKKLQGNTFVNCTSLTSVILPTTLETIGDSEFKVCSSLKTLQIPESVTYIGVDAFARSGLVTIKLPARINRLSHGIFNSCNSITSVDLPIALDSIGKWAFYNCSNLSMLQIPDSVTHIDESAFQASGLVAIKLPEKIEILEYQLFYNCKRLVSISIPKQVKKIGGRAFAGCSSLHYIHVEGDNIVFSSEAFQDCDYVNTLEFDVPQYRGSLFALQHFSKDTKIIVPCGCTDAYRKLFRISTDHSGGYKEPYSNYVEQGAIHYSIVSSNSAFGLVDMSEEAGCDSIITFSAIPLYSHTFTGWSDGNTDNPRTVILTQDTIICALFDNPMQNYKTSNISIAFEEEQGKVVASGQYPQGNSITLSVSPQGCYQFTQWSDGNTDNPRSVVVTGDASYTAEFTREQYTITTNADNAAHGTVSATTEE